MVEQTIDFRLPFSRPVGYNGVHWVSNTAVAARAAVHVAAMTTFHVAVGVMPSFAAENEAVLSPSLLDPFGDSRSLFEIVLAFLLAQYSFAILSKKKLQAF